MHQSNIIKKLNFEGLITIIIPSRSFDFLLELCIQKIRELYSQVKIIVILDDIKISKNADLFNETVLEANSFYISEKRNQGVIKADTEYIAFIDSDAFPYKNWMENGLSFLENNSEYSAVTGPWHQLENESFEQKCIRCVHFSHLFSDKEFLDLINTSARDKDVKLFATANVIMRRKDFINVGLMNDRIYLHEDKEFSERLSKNNYKIRFINNVSVYHRENKLYPYLKKIFCYGYYRTNMFIQEQLNNYKKKYFSKFILKTLYPLICFTLYLLFIIFLRNKINNWILIIPSVVGLIILSISSYLASNNLKQKSIQGFFLILFISIMFCFSYMIGTFLGITNIKLRNFKDLYKHY